MLAAPLPDNEDARLVSLRRMQLLSTPAEDSFDRITRTAARLFNMPTSLITLIDHDRQWFKSAVGMAVSETPRSLSFCGHTILDSKPTIVRDTRLDPRFADNPFVLHDPLVRFYAGRPVTNPEGHVVGTLCLLDYQPRDFGAADVRALHDLAHWVETTFLVRQLSRTQRDLLSELDEARRDSMIDPLLRTWNRRAISDILHRELDKSVRQHGVLTLAMVDLDHFKRINDNHGHPVGDAVLFEAARRMRSVIRGYDSLGRWGGEEFLLIFPEPGGEEPAAIGERIRAAIADGPLDLGDEQIHFTASVGIVAVAIDHNQLDADALIAAADRALYRAKSAGRNCVVSEWL